MTSPARLLAVVVLVLGVAGATALAFFSGGYFTEARLWAGIGAWALLAAGALMSDRPLPRMWGARMALLGLVLLTAWTGISVAWAPLAGPAFEDFQRLLLYVAALAAAASALRWRPAARSLEPALAGGVLIVIGYGLSERLLPGVLHFARSRSAGGRLEQPLTYWNAMGALAAIGFVLAVRVAGDDRRPLPLRAAAAAAAAPLGAGVYLSFSRGALAALAVGLVALVALAPSRSQARAAAIALAAGVLAAIPAGLLSSVRTLQGGLGTRESQGAAMLVLLVLLMAAAALAQATAAARERDDRLSSAAVRVPRGAPVVAAVIAIAVVGVLAAAVINERATTTGSPTFGASSQRLGSVESNRYDYWRVALRSFGRHPLRGGGSSSFQVDWLRERAIPDPAKDAHSLYIETAAELGLIGLGALTLLLGGVALSARRAHARDPGLVAGWIAAACVAAVHAGLDWDWEMPAVALLALILAGALVAFGDEAPPAERAQAGERREPVAAAAA